MHSDSTLICSVPDCAMATHCRGFCRHHYNAWYKYGDPVFRPVRTRSLAERLAAYTDRSETETACWPWISSITSHGYGEIKEGGTGKYLGAHKVAWELASDAPIPDGLWVLHTCDVRRCVRNDEQGIYVVAGVEYPRWGHLFLGPPQANHLDMRAKGRWHGEHIHGEAHPNAKLTEAQVRAIRLRWDAGDQNQSVMGREFAVDASTIKQIGLRLTWRSLPD